MANGKHQTARAVADQVFETGLQDDEIRSALDNLKGDEDAFISRLAVRVSLAAAADANTSDDIVETAAFDAMAIYDSMPAPSVNIADPKVWLNAKTGFGGDLGFVIKLLECRVTVPTARFLRDAADLIGVSLSAMHAHFAAGPLAAGMGIERKASGPQSGPQQESFEAALSKANIPDTLKKRWLEP